MAGDTLRADELISGASELAKEMAELNKQIKATAKTIIEAKSAFDKQSTSQSGLEKKTTATKKALTELEKIQNRANKVTLESVKATEALRDKRKKLTDQVRKDNGTLKKSGGLFKSMTKSILAAGVAFLSLRAAFNVIKNSIKTIAQFEQGMSKVRAVAGALPKEFKALTANAKLLGQTTSKSALQVAGLQLEFSKLGFSTKEILAATEATIQLSIAAGSDLANSAVVAASTVRGFGLSAKDTQRVVDVMAKSFASSSLDIEKFKTAMGVAAPIAKAFGKDIEFTTSRLSVLTDAGIDASTAGTSLRNIFLELSKEGLTWEEGLAKINNSTNKNATALELFGKRGATAALVLADNIDKAKGLEEAYRDSAGAAKRMATIMEDNLIGDTTKLSSVWEGLILTLTSGGNSFNKFLRGAVQGVTNLVSSFQKLVEASPVEEIKAEREEIIKLTGAIQNNALSEEDRLLALEKLQLLAPEVAKGVTLEAESYKALNEQLDLYLDKAIHRLTIASLEEEELKAINKAVKQRVKQEKFLARAFDVLITVNDEYRVSEGLQQDQIKGTIDLLNERVQVQLKTGEAIRGASIDLMTEEQIQLASLNLAYKNLIVAEEKESKIRKESVNPITERIAKYKEEFGLLEEEVELREDIVDVVKKETKAKEDLLKANEALAAKIFELTNSETEIKLESIEKQAEAFRKAGADEIKIDEFVALSKEKIGQGLADKLIKTEEDKLSAQFKLEEDEIQREIDADVALNDEEIERLTTQIDKKFKLEQKAAEEEVNLRKLTEDAKQEIRNAAYDAAGEILSDQISASVDNELNSLKESEEAKNDIAQSALDSQLNNLQLQLDEKRISEEDFLIQKKKVEDDYAKQIKASKLKVRQEEAKAEKKKALYDIAIATAVGIAKALSLVPPASFILAAIVAGLGVAQAAVVASKPIPKFEKGTNGQLRIATDAIVGEKGSELISTPQGDFLSPSSASMVHLPSGSEVFKHDSPETKAAMSGGMSEAHYKGLVASNKEIVKAIDRQKHGYKDNSFNIIETRNNRLKIKARYLE